MSRDRFAELGNNNKNINAYEMQAPRSNGPSIRSRSNSNHQGGFEQQSDDIKSAIERITRNTRELQKLHRKALVEIQNNQAQGISVLV
jgi:hypothetical protein